MTERYGKHPDRMGIDASNAFPLLRNMSLRRLIVVDLGVLFPKSIKALLRTEEARRNLLALQAHMHGTPPVDRIK